MISAWGPAEEVQAIEAESPGRRNDLDGSSLRWGRGLAPNLAGDDLRLGLEVIFSRCWVIIILKINPMITQTRIKMYFNVTGRGCEIVMSKYEITKVCVINYIFINIYKVICNIYIERDG